MNKFHHSIGIIACVWIVSLCGSGAHGQQNASRVAGDSGVRNGADPQKLIATLQNAGASEFDKARACQQLAIIGTKDAADALAPLLGDAHLGNYARCALEAIKDPVADKILRDAMGKLQGKLLVGVINSIGVRRDTQAVAALCKLASDRDAELASAAMAALGRIATPEASDVLLKSLASAPAELRPAVADACLACADCMAAKGQAQAACELYDAAAKADVPKPLRAAALRGAITIRKADGLPLLLEQLRAGDKESVSLALSLVRDFPGPQATTALAGELAKLPPAVQAPLAEALADRKDPAAAGSIETLLGSNSPEVRLAAIDALGKLAASSSIEKLLGIITGGKNEAEADAAAASLARFPGKESAQAVLNALPGASPAASVKLMAVLAGRNDVPAVPTLLKQAASDDPLVAQAAFAALGSLAKGSDLAELVRLAVTCKNNSVQSAAERAVFLTCIKLGPGARSGIILGAVKKNAAPAETCSMLRMLRGVGDYRAFLAVKAALDNSDAQVRDTALRCLADWGDPTPANVLVNLARSTDKVQRTLALRGALRFAGMLAADCTFPSRQTLGWMQQLQKLIDKNSDAEKRMLLSALANFKCLQGLSMVREYIDDPAVKVEAALAVIQIASTLPPSQQPMAKALLQQAQAACSGAAQKKALELLARIPSAAELKIPEALAEAVDVSTLTFTPLFDGKSFEGWEGDTAGTFRIEDGAVVGGSLKAPIPQNEFLCTRRSYANFVLRMECRLTGPTANGGIQIRSLRVPNSAEMCGAQADMSAGAKGGYWGCLYDESRRGGFLGKADPAVIAKAIKPDDWNQYEIRCQGPRIQLFINGVQTVDYTEKDEDILQSGIIGLQIHSGRPSESRYRNITIAEFP